MKISRGFIAGIAILIGITSAAGQKAPSKSASQLPAVFAVLNDGKMIEPIGAIDKGKIVPVAGGDSDMSEKSSFAGKYYRKGKIYDLVFGGSKAGSVTVRSSDPASECASNMAEVAIVSTRAKLKGRVMGLATDHNVRASAGVRRMPTKDERTAAESLARAEFRKQGHTDSDVKTLDYHNLTAVDVDDDGKVELIGSYWITPNTKTRSTLFFIADQGAEGKYFVGFGKYNSVTEENVMGGDITAVDGGVYHELLLDSLDIDGDGVNEVFSYVQSFEGAGFNAYRRSAGKWNPVFEGSNYHCGY